MFRRYTNQHYLHLYPLQMTLQLGRQRQVCLIPLADETQGVQVKLLYPLTTSAIPEHLGDVHV